MQEIKDIRERIPGLVSRFRTHESHAEGKFKHFRRIALTAIPHIFGGKAELALEATSLSAETVAKGILEGIGLTLGIPSPAEIVNIAEEVKGLVEGVEGFDKARAAREMEAHRELHREIPKNMGERLATSGLWFLLRSLWQEEQGNGDNPAVKTDELVKSIDLARIFPNQAQLEYARREIGEIDSLIKKRVEERRAKWKTEHGDDLMPVEVATEQPNDTHAELQRIHDFFEGRERVVQEGHAHGKEVYLFGKEHGGVIHNVALAALSESRNQDLREKALEGAVEAAGEFIVHQDNKLRKRLESEEVARVAKALRSFGIGIGIPLLVSAIKKGGEFLLVGEGVIKTGLIVFLFSNPLVFAGLLALSGLGFLGASFKAALDFKKNSSSIRSLKEEEKDLMGDVENVVEAVLQYYEGKHHAIKELNYHREAKSLPRRHAAIASSSHSAS